MTGDESLTMARVLRLMGDGAARTMLDIIVGVDPGERPGAAPLVGAAVGALTNAGRLESAVGPRGVSVWRITEAGQALLAEDDDAGS